MLDMIHKIKHGVYDIDFRYIKKVPVKLARDAPDRDFAGFLIETYPVVLEFLFTYNKAFLETNAYRYPQDFHFNVYKY